MMKRFVLVIGTLFTTQMSASAQFAPDLKFQPERNAALVHALNRLASGSSDMASVRGGYGSGKPVGFYLNTTAIKFKSGYKNVDAKTQAQFAADLDTFIKSRGGGWNNYVQYYLHRQNPPIGLLTREQLACKDFSDRWYVPYKYQASFASNWWISHDPNFKRLGSVWKDAWIYEAVLDANNLLGRQLMKSVVSAQYMAWSDGYMQLLATKTESLAR